MAATSTRSTIQAFRCSTGVTSFRASISAALTLAALLLFVSKPGPATASGSPCRPIHGRTVQINSKARLFRAPRPTRSDRHADALFGCAESVGKKLRLAPLGAVASEFIYAGTPRRFKLAGVYVGYILEKIDPVSPRNGTLQAFRVKNLADGQVIAQSPDFSQRRVVDPGFVLRRDGAAAWLDMSSTDMVIRAVDASGERVLDQGARGELSAVSSSGPDQVCWTHSGERRCAPLP